MKNFSNHIVYHSATLKDGMIAINKITDEILCLFILDDMQRLIGSLTDGDIRRALILGVLLTDAIDCAMKKDFIFVKFNDVTPNQIKNYRAKNIKLLPCIDDNGKIIKVFNLVARQSVLPIDAVLMAGGKGLRLRPLTETTPKPLLKVGDRAIIDYNVERLIKFGVENIHVNINYLAEQIESHFADEKDGIKIACVREPKFLGTIGSVKFITNFHNDLVLVMNSDLFTNIDFEEFYLNHIEQNSDMSVATIPYSISVPFGIIELKDQIICGLREKPTYTYYANGGVYLVKRHLLDLIPKNAYFDATEFIELLITQNYKVTHFPIIGYWIDIGKPEDYYKACELAKHIKFNN